MSNENSTRLDDARTGFVAGALNGLIGIGGGIVIVPRLIARGATPQVAVGTSLAAVVVLSGIAFIGHAAVTGVTLGAAAFGAIVAAGIAGAAAGAWILARLTVRRMLLLFALLVFGMSLRLVVQGLGLASPEPLWPGPPTLLGYTGVGLASGLLSGLFGVGGGALVVLGLAALFGVPVHTVLPIALAVNVTNAAVGAASHAVAGRVRVRSVLALVPAAVVGIAVGTMLALWLAPDVLRVVFGGFFCVMGVRIARQALRR